MEDLEVEVDASLPVTEVLVGGGETLVEVLVQ
jgi:hypothetical protein